MTPDVSQITGQYLGRWSTAVLAAALAADAPICSLRCGPTQTPASIQGGTRKVYVQEIGLRFSILAAFTAAQQFGFYLQRFTGANMAGGTATAMITNLHGNGASVTASVCTPGGGEGGDIRSSTTGALTVAGVTLVGGKIPVYGWTTAAAGADIPAIVLTFRDAPLRLDLGEGIALLNSVVWPAAGTGVFTGWIRWAEAVY